MEVLFRLQNELFLDRLVSEFWFAADQECISLSWVIAQFSKQKDRFAVHFVVEHLRHLELTKTYLFSVDWEILVNTLFLCFDENFNLLFNKVELHLESLIIFECYLLCIFQSSLQRLEFFPCSPDALVHSSNILVLFILCEKHFWHVAFFLHGLVLLILGIFFCNKSIYGFRLLIFSHINLLDLLLLALPFRIWLWCCFSSLLSWFRLLLFGLILRWLIWLLVLLGRFWSSLLITLFILFATSE